jgi:hypothetical protein
LQINNLHLNKFTYQPSSQLAVYPFCTPFIFLKDVYIAAHEWKYLHITEGDKIYETQ